MLRNLTAVAAVCVAALGQSAGAGPAWTEIRSSVFGDRAILDGHGVITFDAPVRPNDMRVVPLSVSAGFNDGRTVKSITILIDENPTPVVAELRVGPGRHHMRFKGNFRVDRQSDARVVVEANDGQLYSVSRLIKYAGGQSSCSAPPTGDPAEIAANMGKMSLKVLADNVKASAARLDVELTLHHPNHTGMVMDQQTLLYTPMNMVSEIEVRQGSEPVFLAKGSIALSQDPNFLFDFARNGASEITVTFRDTDGGAWTRAFPIGPQS